MSPQALAARIRVFRERERRKDIRAGLVACIIANANRKKGAPAFSINDFIGNIDGEE